MIFGDSASGKSTFATHLSKLLNVPVIHLDEIMAQLGRHEREAIAERIEQLVMRPEWIIEGNAFTKDKSRRIAAADMIIVFDFNRFLSLAHHVQRSLRIRRGKEQGSGGVTGTLNLRYYIPYILWQFPKRKNQAIRRSLDGGKPVIRLKNRRQARNYLKNQG